MAAVGNSFFWLADLKKSSSLKPFCQMNRNLVGSINGRSSIRIAHFVPIHYQTWLPPAILVSDWSISKNLLLWNRLAKWTAAWEEASMEGSVLNFLRAEWKVSNTAEPLVFIAKWSYWSLQKCYFISISGPNSKISCIWKANFYSIFNAGFTKWSSLWVINGPKIVLIYFS